MRLQFPALLAIRVGSEIEEGQRLLTRRLDYRSRHNIITEDTETAFIGCLAQVADDAEAGALQIS